MSIDFHTKANTVTRLLDGLSLGLSCLLRLTIGFVVTIACCVNCDFIYSITTSNCSPNIKNRLRLEPDRIIFASNRDHNNEIYIMNADGSRQTNLTNNPADDRLPVASPDGKTIAFVSNRSGYYQIYTVDVDGGNLQNLSNSTTDEGGDSSNSGFLRLYYFQKAIMWTDDGKQIIYGASDNSYYQININGSGKRKLQDFEDTLFEPSPDGKLLAYLYDDPHAEHGEDYSIWLKKADGTQAHQLTEAFPLQPQFNWAPPSARIAFSAAGIRIVDIDTLESSAVFINYGLFLDIPNWSSDEHYLAFERFPNRGVDRREEGLENYEIWAVDTQNSEPCLLTLSQAYSDYDPNWVHATEGIK